MRSDMGRVVIEGARSGSSSPGLKVKRVGKMRAGGSGLDDEDGPWFDGPSRVPVSASRQHAHWTKLNQKSFTDVLGPLRGYLRKSVGRRWDDVYSELSRGLGGFSWPMQHVLTEHVDVETHTWMENGEVWSRGRYGGRAQCMSEPSWGWRDEFYVHPVTRCLCAVPMARRRWRASKRHLDRVQVPGTSDRWYVFVRGLWFVGTYVQKPFVGTVREVGRWGHTRAVEPEVEWPHYRVSAGEGYGTWFFMPIKSANKREAAEARRLYAARLYAARLSARSYGAVG